jgi:hypothetical protein
MSGADWRAIECIAPPRFDEGTLRSWFDRVDPGLLIRSGLKRSDILPVNPPVWDREALSELFGLDRPTHCFHTTPHVWASFHEPQITCGFAHFLNEGGAAQRLARAVALLKAAMACAGKDPAIVDALGATSARCKAEENRTDILVELQHSDRRIGTSIEAKFRHRLTRGQLPKAKRHAESRGWTMEDSALLVVAPGDAKVGQTILRNYRNAGWRTTDWATLILKIEAFTDARHDCADYRRFRRTVWYRAH